MNVNQKAYDTVKAHLLSQMAVSRLGPLGPADSSKPPCAYRGAGGLKCAVGCLIPDERYSKAMDPGGIYNLFVVGGPEVLGEFSSVSCDLLRNLQLVHDTCEPAGWRSALAKVAVKYGLTP